LAAFCGGVVNFVEVWSIFVEVWSILQHGIYCRD